MSDDSTEGIASGVLTADHDDLQFLLEWQQQRYQHLQSLTLALIGAIITIFALIFTIYGGSDLPKSAELTPSPTQFGFSEPALAMFYLFNLIAIIVGATFLLVLARTAVKRLFRLAFGPQLHPRLANTVILPTSALENSRVGRPAKFDLMNAVNANIEILRRSRYDFKAAVGRVVIWFSLAALLYFMFGHLLRGETFRLLRVNLLIALPLPAAYSILKRYLSNGDSGVEDEEMLGISDSDIQAEQSPLEFFPIEKRFSQMFNGLLLIAILALLLDFLL